MMYSIHAWPMGIKNAVLYKIFSIANNRQVTFCSSSTSFNYSTNVFTSRHIFLMPCCCCYRLLFMISSFVSAASWRLHPVLDVVLRCRRRRKSMGTQSQSGIDDLVLPPCAPEVLDGRCLIQEVRPYRPSRFQSESGVKVNIGEQKEFRLASCPENHIRCS